MANKPAAKVDNLETITMTTTNSPSRDMYFVKFQQKKSTPKASYRTRGASLVFTRNFIREAVKNYLADFSR